MEALPKDIMIEFNPDTLEAVRKEFNLDKPGRVDEAIDILDGWVKKQTHFTKKDFSRDYLERTIGSCKGSVERAKKRMDSLCTFKTLVPNFFKSSNQDFDELKTFITHAHLPKMTPDHYRVYVCKMTGSEDWDSNSMLIYYRYIIMVCEYMKMYEYSKGFILIIDYSHINIMSLVTKLNVLELRQAMALMMDGYGMRLKGLHVITPSKAVNAIVSILKQVVSEKLGGRIQVHKTFETLYEHVPQRILPQEFDGEERSLKKLNDEWLQVLGSKEYLENLNEMFKARTIESYRLTNNLDHYIGMPGSFRSLGVD